MASESNKPSSNVSQPDRPVTGNSLRTKETLKKLQLEDVVTRDWLHNAALFEQKEREANIVKHKIAELDDYKAVRTTLRPHFPSSILYGQGYSGYGNGRTQPPDDKARIMYPMQKPRPARKRTALVRVKRKDGEIQAEQVEDLVPIRLEIDLDKIKFRDTFTWNLHDRVVSIDIFAQQLVEDFGFEGPAANHVLEQIRFQMTEQLQDFYPHVHVEEDALDPELPYHAYKNDEMRIVIRLNITIGAHTLVDQFEWDINNPLNSPEEFAYHMAHDLSLSGEFITAIAHCIREQTQLFTRSLHIVGHPFDGRPVEDADLVASLLSPVSSVLRPQQQAKDYLPSIWESTEAELEKNEVAASREQRRQKRSVNRRGGPTLPDLKDRPRTVRTLVVHSVIPGAAHSVEDSRLYKRTQGLSGRGKKSGRGEFDQSGSSDDDDSGPDSPALTQSQQGTARTRGMRGAATVAQQRMANIGRSETPEINSLNPHHHETRTSARRFGGREVREDSVDAVPSLIVKLRINKERFRQWNQRLGSRPSTSQGNSASQSRSQNSNLMKPPTTPGIQTTSAINPPQKGASHLGRVPAPPPPGPGESALVNVSTG